MRWKIITLTVIVASLAAAVYGYHQRNCETTAAVQAAQGAVDTLYRNDAHTMPATNLTARKISSAKAVVQKTKTEALSGSQKVQLQKADAELSAASQMYTVTTATQAPVAPTPSYQHTAETAITAYHRLQTAKPVFTQVYQQPVSNLGQAAKAVSTLNDLQTAEEVSKAAITKAKTQVEQVTDGEDTAFAAEAAQVVSEAEQKVTTPETDSKPESTATEYVEPATPTAESSSVETKAPVTATSSSTTTASQSTTSHESSTTATPSTSK